MHTGGSIVNFSPYTRSCNKNKRFRFYTFLVGLWLSAQLPALLLSVCYSHYSITEQTIEFFSFAPTYFTGSVVWHCTVYNITWIDSVLFLCELANSTITTEMSVCSKCMRSLGMTLGAGGNAAYAYFASLFSFTPRRRFIWSFGLGFFFVAIVSLYCPVRCIILCCFRRLFSNLNWSYYCGYDCV